MANQQKKESKYKNELQDRKNKKEDTKIAHPTIYCTEINIAKS